VEEGRERTLTAVLLGLCLLLAGAGLAPRLHVRRAVPVPVLPELQVAIDGAVRTPGRYELAWGARVGDLVDVAGGLAAGAADDLVDPAAPLVDGQRVHVPHRARADGGGRVSLNEASRAELQSLPGIGPALADRIVAARPFHALDDLRRVRGIGPVTMRRLRDRIGL
jgi:competence protein ComEA